MPQSEKILASCSQVTEWRRSLHQHPELGFEEYWTSDFICEQLTKLNIPFERGIGKTGIVATLKGKQTQSGKSLGLRADMDALPIQEIGEQEYCSTTPGKMHACGHDGHTAMLLGAAKYLSENPEFDGTAYLIFQPAEEGRAGAKKMIEDGVFDKYPCDYVFGMHNWPSLPVGKIGVLSGPIMASSDEFTIDVIGRGGHAAMPHQTIDPLLVGVEIIHSLQSILSRNIDPLDQAVVSVTQFHAGDTHNIIAEKAFIQGTVRCFSEKTRSYLQKRIEQIAQSVALAHQAKVIVNYHWNYPATINDAEASIIAHEVASQLCGDGNVLGNGAYLPSMGAEDFSYMLQQCKGCYIHVGQGTADSASPHNQNLHNPAYDFNDEILPIGIEYWVSLVETYLPLKV